MESIQCDSGYSMLLRSLGGLARSALIGGRRTNIRQFCAASGDDGEKNGKEPNVKEVLGEEMIKAVDAVATELGGDKEKSKGLKSSLLSRLISHEKETFNSATSDQTAEMMSDPAVMAVFKDAASTQTKPIPNAIHERKAKRGLVLLRKEVFYQAIQSGYSASDSRRISEEAVDEAERRLIEKRMGEKNELNDMKMNEQMKKVERDEKEDKLYDMAYALAEKMLYGADGSEGKLAALATKVIEADPSAPRFLSSTKRLNIFKDVSKLEKRRIGFWEDWELRAAQTWNQSLGPENAFEEQIEWTKKGAQWPYPINNEYLLGDELNVPFYEHIFVDRRLAASNLPKDGPIAHFMHLVAVGLSKNPHMTSAKKASHIDWFINFFNVEKQKLVHKLHEQEQAAAAAQA